MKREVCILVFPASAGVHRGWVQGIQKKPFEELGRQQCFPWQKINSEHSTTPHLGFPGRGDFLCSFYKNLCAIRKNSVFGYIATRRIGFLKWQSASENFEDFFRKSTRNWDFFLFQIHSCQKGNKLANSSVILGSSCPEKIWREQDSGFSRGYQTEEKISLKAPKNVRFFHFQYIADRRERIPTESNCPWIKHLQLFSPKFGIWEVRAA